MSTAGGASRLILVHTRGRGAIYPYFDCSGRQYGKSKCDFRDARIEYVEDLGATEHAKLVIPGAQHAQIRHLLNARYDEMMAEARPEFDELTAQKKAIKDEKDGFSTPT